MAEPVKALPTRDEGSEALACLLYAALALFPARQNKPPPIPHPERLVLSGAITCPINRR